VFVIHWNAPERCAETVTSLLDSRGVDIAVTVIDNGSARLPDLPGQVMVEQLPQNCGYAGAANRALRLSREAELVVIASHDVEVAPDCLMSLVRYARSRPRVGIVGPYMGADTVADRWIQGDLMLLRRTCVDEVGAFDELFGSYCEEVDYCHRALDRGWLLAIADGANASSTGRMHPRLAEVLMEANFIVLAAKEGCWGRAARNLVGLVRKRRWESIRIAVVRLSRLGGRQLRETLH
jgi:N-acetylglucosaminyl-diphospho-decaprenol L-rhamnosyltransferase